MVGGNRRCPYLSQIRRRIEKLFVGTGEHLEILGLTTRSDRTVASIQQVIIEMAKRRKGVVEVDHFCELSEKKPIWWETGHFGMAARLTMRQCWRQLGGDAIWHGCAASTLRVLDCESCARARIWPRSPVTESDGYARMIKIK